MPRSWSAIGRIRSSTSESSAAGWLDHLPQHHFPDATPSVPCQKSAAESERTNARNFFSGGRARRRSPGNSGYFSSALLLGITQNLGVKRLLVAKMVIDGGNIRARAAADFAHGRVAEAGFGEHPARRLQKLAARFIMALGLAVRPAISNSCFKRIIKTFV